MPITQTDLDNLFRYHKPHGDQPERYERIRHCARLFAGVILEDTPPGADQAAAIRHLRECVMTANAAIACGEPEPTSPVDVDTRKEIKVEKV
ncbi:MAG: hypothetical protein AMXMBFR7_52970 [Planctomycetota bacterium]